MSDRERKKRPSSLLRYIEEGSAAPQKKAVEQAPVQQERPKWKKLLLIVGLSLLGVILLTGAYILFIRPALNRPGSATQPTPLPGEATADPVEHQTESPFLPAQDHPETGWEGFKTLVGDVNGDGRSDLVWNLTQESNLIYVGLAQKDGSFQFLPVQEREEKRWNGFQTWIGDVNGDGRSDLIWNETAETNRIYVGLARKDGTFQLLPAQDREEKHWEGFQTWICDVNGDRRSDIIWNELAETNRVYVGLGQADGSFQFPPPQDHSETGWGDLSTLIGDVNGDGRSDLIWNKTAEMNRIYVALGQADGSFDFQLALDHPEKGWDGTVTLAGDVNGDGRTDLIWNRLGEANRIHLGLFQNDGTLRFPPTQYHPESGWSGFQTLLGDTNRDGRSDLIWNETAETNRIYVGLAGKDATFEFLPLQEHGEKGWSGFQTLVGDVNGDGRVDLIWNSKGETNRIHVWLNEETDSE